MALSYNLNALYFALPNSSAVSLCSLLQILFYAHVVIYDKAEQQKTHSQEHTVFWYSTHNWY